jgi:hypothetical protein
MADFAENKAKLAAYGFRLDPWDDFEKSAPAAVMERARAVGLPRDFVAWDPEGNEDGWCLVGDAELVARETCEMIEDSASTAPEQQGRRANG